jgi:two-component system, chemotaxis family, sensor kinase CheA
MEGLQRMERCLTELETRPEDGELLAEIFRIVHTIKGTTGFLGHGRIETMAHAGESLLSDMRVGKVAVGGEVVSGLLGLKDWLGEMVAAIASEGKVSAPAAEMDTELAGLMAELRGGHGARSFEDVVLRKLEPVPPVEETQATVVAAETTLRVDVDVLNRMMNLVGELVLTRNQLLQSKLDAETFPELSRRLDSVTADLRETVMQARMQPVGNLFEKFPRMVRDLARSCGRGVRVECEGAETGLDKSLLEAIKDPLTHAVRNAVDHGIEPPLERMKLGKPAQGVVRLRAYQRNGSVVIEVADDGAGISRERVLQKAIERGLVGAERAAEMADRDVLQLIFLPGFSTAETVTHVSGRGVGMDVVRSNVEKAGGTVEIESRVGAGTVLRLRLPLTLAIVPALVVSSGGQSFAVPQSALVELVYVPGRDAAKAIEQMGSAELYRLRGKLLPVVWLDRLLKLGAVVGSQVDSRGFYIAVLEAESLRFGLAVDDLLAPEEIVVKPISRALRKIGLFSGATMLGNGVLAMILDIAATATRAGVRPMAEAARGAGARPEAVLDADRRRGIEPIRLEDSMVIFEVRPGERMAMPLSAVERIESVPVCDVEFSRGQALLQSRGDVIALEDEGDLLQELRAAASGDRTKRTESSLGLRLAERWAASDCKGATVADEVTVLICFRPTDSGMKRCGVVVRRVLDIAAGVLVPDADPEAQGRLARVKNRLTTVHAAFAGQMAASEMYREVA